VIEEKKAFLEIQAIEERREMLRWDDCDDSVDDDSVDSDDVDSDHDDGDDSDGDIVDGDDNDDIDIDDDNDDIDIDDDDDDEYSILSIILQTHQGKTNWYWE
jgi:hypothetical protein